MEKIYINYGEKYSEMTFELMEMAKIHSYLNPEMEVTIKPNLVVSKPANDGATTHPEVVEGIIQYLQENDVNNITIAEGAWVGEKNTDKAFKNCGYVAISKKYGVPLLDTKKDDVVEFQRGNLSLKVCKTFVKTDYLINVPVLKGHCQTKITCCLKNIKGCIPDSEKRRYHSLGLHEPIAALNSIIKPSLHVVDNICGDLTFEEGGNPVSTDRILLGFDPLLLDSYCGKLIGYNPNKIEFLSYGRKFDLGNLHDENTKIIEMNNENKALKPQVRSDIAQKLGEYIDEDSACSACYAALIFALDKIAIEDFQEKIKEKIKIGQGFKGKECDGIGVGNCTNSCLNSLKGCPPSGLDILEFIKSL